MNIFSYWQGPRPEYIQVCIDSMARVLGNDFHLVTPETVDQWIPAGTLNPTWRKLSQPALRADCIRAALLAVHGGWWWDADTIAFRHPDCICTSAPCLYMTWTNSPRRILNGYIYMEPGYEGSRRWLARINEELVKGSAGVDWCSLGEKLLTDDLSSDSVAIEIPRRLFLPVDIDKEVHHFFENQEWGWWTFEDTVCFGLNHSYFMYHYSAKMTATADERRDSPLMIHRLIEYARSAA